MGAPTMAVPRIIELSFSFLAAFLVLILLSFLTARPMLNDVKSEARGLWDDFRSAVGQRNDFLPGVVEGARGFLPGSGKLAERLLEVRAVSMRATDPDEVVASVDAMEAQLRELERCTRSSTGPQQHALFAAQWQNVKMLTRRIQSLRHEYNRAARVYNGLLRVFPQNMVAAAFGFVPLKSYPRTGAVTAEDASEWSRPAYALMTASLSTKQRATARRAPLAGTP
jgi:hypothetical protein